MAWGKLTMPLPDLRPIDMARYRDFIVIYTAVEDESDGWQAPTTQQIPRSSTRVLLDVLVAQDEVGRPS